MAAITGLASGPAPARGGQALLDHVHPDDVDALRREGPEQLRRLDRCDLKFRFMRPDDGRQIWMALTALPERGGGGEIAGVVGVVRDISAEIGEADQKDALVAELDHRVKNVLASVQSLAAQSARNTVSLDAFLKTFSGRLEAMAAAHTLLTATRWRGAAISQIAAAELGGLAQGQACWEGPAIVLNARATHALTLALHELSANAVRHGALSAEAGRVEARWRETADGGFELTWTEVGGPIVTTPARRGFGRTLLERVTGRELGGEVRLDFRSEGLRAVLTGNAGARAAPDAPGPERIQPPPPPAAEPPAGASRGVQREADIRGLRILIVEDAVLLGLELESGLTECGAHVVGAAADLAEALSMLDLDFDAAVLDANLNGQSVTPVAKILLSRGVPFIFATGHGEAGAAPEGFSAPVVRKPYNIRQIAAALAIALGRS
jgi:two-component sensor histidine kinase/CheY-like chemotaxis protein